MSGGNNLLGGPVNSANFRFQLQFCQPITNSKDNCTAGSALNVVMLSSSLLACCVRRSPRRPIHVRLPFAGLRGQISPDGKCTSYGNGNVLTVTQVPSKTGVYLSYFGGDFLVCSHRQLVADWCS